MTKIKEGGECSLAETMVKAKYFYNKELKMKRIALLMICIMSLIPPVKGYCFLYSDGSDGAFWDQEDDFLYLTRHSRNQTSLRKKIDIGN